MKRVLVGLGLLSLLGGTGFAGEKTDELTARGLYRSSDPGQRRRVRLNRGVFNLVGQQPNVPGTCGPDGAAGVRTKSNGWDLVLGIATVGLYTPQHAYLVCNPPARR